MLDLVIKIEKITSSYTVIQNNVWCCVDGYLTQFSLVALDRIKKVMFVKTTKQYHFTITQ